MTRVYNRADEKSKRRALRSNMPLPEIILWSKLKGGGIGYKFRRQHSIGAFVLDFCCPVLKLAIEVDGDSHYSDEAIMRDRERQKIIENYGFRFLRFTNTEIVENVDSVIAAVMQYIERLTTPAPPCKGGDSTDSFIGREQKGREVVTSKNYLIEPESRKRLERKK